MKFFMLVETRKANGTSKRLITTTSVSLLARSTQSLHKLKLLKASKEGEQAEQDILSCTSRQLLVIFI